MKIRGRILGSNSPFFSTARHFNALIAAVRLSPPSPRGRGEVSTRFEARRYREISRLVVTRPGNELLVIVVVERKRGGGSPRRKLASIGRRKKTIGDRVELMMNVGDGLAARFKSFSFFLFPLPPSSKNPRTISRTRFERDDWRERGMDLDPSSFDFDEKGKNSTFSNEPFDSFQIFGHS